MRRVPAVLLLGAACLSACASTEGGGTSFADLFVGMVVEAKGPATTGTPEVTEIEQLEASSSTKSDKFELTTPVQSDLAGGAVTALGQTFAVTDKTTFEDLDRDEVQPFPVRAGDWVKIKARSKDDEPPHARTIRQAEPRSQFDVEGEITELDVDRHVMRVGAIPLRVAQDANIDVIEGANPNDPLALFLADERKGVPFSVRLADNLRLGGEGVGKYEVNDEFDLDKSRSSDRTKTSLDAKLDLLWRFDEEGSFVLLEGKVGRGDRFREGGEDTARRSDQISRAYAYVKLTEELRLQVGRQDFDEEREWLYDEILDGVRLRAMLGDFDFEAAAAFGREFLAENNPTEDTSTFLGLVRYHLDEDHFVTAYFIQRKDSEPDNFEPILYGVRSFSRPSKGLGHWVEAARSAGYEGFTRIDGYAFDVGLMYRFDLPLRPTVAVGYAYGSGKREQNSRMGFRQTGLQDNNAKFGGVTSFRYYGEVLEPELSNLHVTTAGLGFRPLRDLAVDFVAHTYRQDDASTVLVDTNLRTRPNGLSRDLGWGADVIVGYRHRGFLTAELIGGMFEPGDGFDRDDTAQKLEMQVRVKF